MLSPSEVRYQPSELYAVLFQVKTCSPLMAAVGLYQNDTVRSAGCRRASVPSDTALEPVNSNAWPASPVP